MMGLVVVREEKRREEKRGEEMAVVLAICFTFREGRVKDGWMDGWIDR